MKIVDCFIFYNELDLLNYRVNILNNVVDYFVLVESTHTHSGKEKELIYQNNKEMFQSFHHKIIHIIVDDFPYKYPNINYDNKSDNSDSWHNERFQRNCIVRGIQQLSLSLTDDDVIIISDLDEIPDPTTLLKIKKNKINITLNALQMDFYYYNLNSKKEMMWCFSKMLLYKYFNELIQKKITCSDIRLNNIYLNPIEYIINNGGWHLSYFGDAHFIKNKLENFAHQEFNNKEYTNVEKIEKRITTGVDLFERSTDENLIMIPVKENAYLPPEYESYLQKFIFF
jgi:beta-1,4-mannosyl-glycoprotein beta-1,4-N-acetylglucosaminyltransferase